MKRPMLWALIYFISGVLFSSTIIIAGQYELKLLSIVLFFVLILLITISIYGRYKWIWVFLFPLFCLLGYVRGIDSATPRLEIDALALSRSDVIIEGTVTERTLTKSGRTKIILRTDNIKDQNGLSYENTDLRILAVLDENDDASVGMQLKVQGVLELPEQLRNPGGFDESAYFRTRGLSYKIFPSALVTGDHKINPIILINLAKDKLAYSLDVAFLPNEASIMKSIIIGDKSCMDEAIMELYRIGGIYHVLAISGLHISILALALRSLLSTICRRRTAGVITLFIISVYCVMTGASPSTVRAVIMCGIIIIGELLYRESDLLTSTSFACLMILIYRPAYLSDVGFQFSFSAVFGLAVLSLPIERLLVLLGTKLPFILAIIKNTKIKSLIAGNIAALLATYPILSYHFYYITPYSFFVNLLIIPTISLLVMIGFAVALVGLVSVPAAVFLAGTATYILRYYEFICSLFAKLPYARLLTGFCRLPVYILFYMTVLSMAYMFYGFGGDFYKRRKYFGAMCTVIFAFFMISRYTPTGLTVTYLDVGQGDCIVIHDKYSTYIIDGGGQYGKELGENTGARVLLSYLDYLGVDVINGAFITHGDSDHATGVVELIALKNVSEIFIPKSIITTTNDELITELKNRCDQYRIPLTPIENGDRLDAGGFVFDILHPFSEKKLGEADIRNNNDDSLVIMLCYENTRLLFTGDIGVEAEASLLMSGADISADILKLAHHGSRYSNSEDFIKAVDPFVAVVSASERNVYGHPAVQVTDFLKKQGIPLYGTMNSGAITIRINDKISIETMGGKNEGT